MKELNWLCVHLERNHIGNHIDCIDMRNLDTKEKNDDQTLNHPMEHYMLGITTKDRNTKKEEL